MSKAVLLDAFYTQVSDFLGELSRVFPYDLDFPTYRTQFALMRKANPTLALKQFGLYTSVLEPVLQTRSADVFMTCEVPPELAGLVEKLRGYWLYMTPENQSVVWSYLTLLTQIAKRYSGLPPG